MVAVVHTDNIDDVLKGFMTPHYYSINMKQPYSLTRFGNLNLYVCVRYQNPFQIHAALVTVLAAVPLSARSLCGVSTSELHSYLTVSSIISNITIDITIHYDNDHPVLIIKKEKKYLCGSPH